MGKRGFHRRAKDAGFILVESVLSWVVLGIIALTFAVLFSLGLTSYSQISSRTEAIANGRYALNRMVQEILPVKSSDILSISPTQFQFVDDIGNVTDFHSAPSGGVLDLYRGPDLLARNLTSFNFSYYDAAGNLITDYGNPSAVRRIQLDMTLKDMSGFSDVTVRGEVYPRNFYYSNFQ